LSGRFLNPGPAAPGDDDFASALFGKNAGCRLAEPGSGAGDEGDRKFHGVSVVTGEGRAVFPLNLSMLCPVFICLAALQTQEYDNHSDNARSFVRNGN
jgi:hypothetical protein